MASEGGPTAHSVIERLRQAPHEFDFFQAIRWLDAAQSPRGRVPRIGHAHRAGDELVRLGQMPNLAFSPASIAAVIEGKIAAAVDGETPEGPAIPPRIYVNFLGLLGPNGILPLHVTEYIRDRELNHDDPTLARFLDIFHHRVLTLFYRAWAGAQQAVSYQRPDDDRFAAYIGSIIGRGMESMRNRDAIPDESKLFFAGRLAAPTRNAEGLSGILSEYFGAIVRIEQFVGQWLELDAGRRLHLGITRGTGMLGSTAIVGGRIWDRQQKFRIHMGPMDFEAYQRLLPGGVSLQRLVAWVHNYLGDEYSFDVRLSLKAENVPATQLGRLGRLGWSTWLLSAPARTDAEDLTLSPAA